MRSVSLFRNEKAQRVIRPFWDLPWSQKSGRRSVANNNLEDPEPDPYEGNFSFTDCDQYAKVTVVGAAGRVGRTLSLLLKTCPLVDHLCLFDTDKSVKGIGLDISHIDTKCSISNVCGMRNIHQALDAPDVVVIAAGYPISPQVSRDKLFEKNAPIIAGLGEACARFCPKACVVLITNPINSLLPVMGEVYQLINNRIPSRKLFGLTTLDVVRANTFVAEVVRKNPNSIIVPVVGGASKDTIVPVISQMKPCCKIKHGEQLALTECIKRAEENLADCQYCGTPGASSLSTAYAAFRFTSSLVMALKGAENIVECAYVKSDIIPDLEYLASPLKLGIRGVEHNFGYPQLSDYEVSLMEEAAARLINDIDMGKCFVVQHQGKQKKYFRRCDFGKKKSFFNKCCKLPNNNCNLNNDNTTEDKMESYSPNESKQRDKSTLIKPSEAKRAEPKSEVYKTAQDLPVCDNKVSYAADYSEDKRPKYMHQTCKTILCENKVSVVTDNSEEKYAEPVCHICGSYKEQQDRDNKETSLTEPSKEKWMECKFVPCICPKEPQLGENTINASPETSEENRMESTSQLCQCSKQLQISQNQINTAIESSVEKWMESKFQNYARSREQLVSFDKMNPSTEMSGEKSKFQICLCPKEQLICENKTGCAAESSGEKCTKSKPQTSRGHKEKQVSERKDNLSTESSQPANSTGDKQLECKPQTCRSTSKEKKICENKTDVNVRKQKEITSTVVEVDKKDFCVDSLWISETVSTTHRPEENKGKKPRKQNSYYRRCRNNEGRKATSPKPAGKKENDTIPRKRFLLKTVEVKGMEESIQESDDMRTHRSPNKKDNYHRQIKIEKI